MRPIGPIITLTTDFGLNDWYVATLKSVLYKACPSARLVDVTHSIPPGNLLAGSVCLERAIASFEPGTVHLAVVDPGVGTARRMIIAQTTGQLLVCPDNGLITWAMRRHGLARAWEITWRPPDPSATFHGRDIMGPVAGMLAADRAPDEFGSSVHDPLLLDLAPVGPDAQAGQIIYFDHFGNAITNILADALRPNLRINIAGHDIGPLRSTYGVVPPGQPLALVGSSGLLEISVRDGSAREALRLNIADPVRLL